MRNLLLGAWLLVPVGAWAYHEGPGQDLLKLDTVDTHLRRAHDSAAAQDWALAVTEYEAALKAMPKGQDAATQRARLELNKARMLAKQLPTAHAELTSLVNELAAAPASDATLLADSRSALANSQYYMTWLMRLEGQPREKWEPEVEAARQTYRLLAEQAEQQGDKAGAKQHKEDLESAVRLARMDIKDLQGLPLPSQ
jgi:hypothetical protein